MHSTAAAAEYNNVEVEVVICIELSKMFRFSVAAKDIVKMLTVSLGTPGG